jgi:hypothetical protein
MFAPLPWTDADRVPRAVREELRVSGFDNHRAAGVVHLEAVQRLALRDRALHPCDGGVARVAYGGEYAAHPSLNCRRKMPSR